MESVASPRAHRRWSLSAQAWRSWLGHAWLVPILLLAAWLRFAGLGNEHLYGDEAEYAIVARYLSRDMDFLAYPALEGNGITPFVSQPPLILYLMALSMKLFGPTDFAAILPTALLGVATVAVVYAIGVRLGGRFAGLSAAALLAVLPFHVEMSRRAMLDVGFAFFLMLTIYFAVAWLQTRSRGHAVGVGAACAATCLTKLPGILAGPIVLGVFLVGLALVLVARLKGQAPRGAVRETFVQGALGAAPVALGALLYVGLLWHLEAVQNLWVKLQWQLGRVDTSQAVTQELTMVHRDASFYLSDPNFGFAAQLGGVVFALALAGLLVATLRFAVSPRAQAGRIVVPLATLVLASFFFWSDRKEGFYLLPFVPLATILVAETATALRDLIAWAGIRFTPRLAPRAAIAAVAIAALLVAVPAASATKASYNDFVKGDTQEKYFGSGTREAAQWIHERDPEAGQYGTLLGRFTLYWYNEQPTYHWYAPHTIIEGDIQSGKLEYIVYDEYLHLEFDESFMKGLINKYNGEKVAEFRQQNWAVVQVYKLNP